VFLWWNPKRKSYQNKISRRVRRRKINYSEAMLHNSNFKFQSAVQCFFVLVCKTFKMRTFFTLNIRYKSPKKHFFEKNEMSKLSWHSFLKFRRVSLFKNASDFYKNQKYLKQPLKYILKYDQIKTKTESQRSKEQRSILTS
jgi:hypothetical protein